MGKENRKKSEDKDAGVICSVKNSARLKESLNQFLSGNVVVKEIEIVKGKK